MHNLIREDDIKIDLKGIEFRGKDHSGYGSKAEFFTHGDEYLSLHGPTQCRNQLTNYQIFKENLLLSN
jgi:hypothetical protein